MNPRSFVRCFPAAWLVVSAGIGLSAAADQFRAVILDEGTGQPSYQIVDAKGAVVLVLRDRAEYASTELRAGDVAGRLNRAVDNQQNHGDLLFLVDWSHGGPTIRQVSRDGTIRYLIIGFTATDVERWRRSGGFSDAVEFARASLDRVDHAVESAMRAEAAGGKTSEDEATEAGAGAGDSRPGQLTPAVIKEKPPEGAREPERENPPRHGAPLEHENALGQANPTDREATPAPGGASEPERIPSVSETAPEAKSSALRLRVDPIDAVFYLDGRLTNMEATPIAVTPGRHTIDLVRPGYEPYHKEIVVPSGQVVRIAVALERQ